MWSTKLPRRLPFGLYLDVETGRNVLEGTNAGAKLSLSLPSCDGIKAFYYVSVSEIFFLFARRFVSSSVGREQMTLPAMM